MAVAVSAGGGPPNPKSLSETFSERDFRLAGGPATYRERLGWPRYGSASTAMAPGAGTERNGKPGSSDLGLSERSKTAHITACANSTVRAHFEGSDKSGGELQTSFLESRGPPPGEGYPFSRRGTAPRTLLAKKPGFEPLQS